MASPTDTPTAEPIKIPTFIPTPYYQIVEITDEVIVTRSDARENFLIESQLNTEVRITGNGGNDKYTITVRSGLFIIITDFDVNNEIIDLTSFNNIHSLNDLTITFGSAVINLPGNQKIKLLNISPSDLTENNFHFSPDVSSENNDLH